MYVVMCCSVHKLKLLIKEQTDLDPCYQELFYENLPYRPAQAELAAKLPTTTVSSWHVHITYTYVYITCIRCIRCP